jgi:NADH:ubiquinone oxidoreductase subunit 6 (subunit J)
MFASLVDLFRAGNTNPTAILSNPIISRTAETIRIIVCVVILGYVRVTIVKIMAVTPKPNSKSLNQSRDFLSFLLLLLLSLLFECVSVVKHHLQ